MSGGGARPPSPGPLADGSHLTGEQAVIAIALGVIVVAWALAYARRNAPKDSHVAFSWLIAIAKAPAKRKLHRRSYLIDFLLSSKKSRDFHANLEDLAPIWKAAYGRRRAEWLRRKEIMLAIWWHVLAPVLAIWETVRRFI